MKSGYWMGYPWITRQCVKKQRHYFADKSPYSQSYGLSNSHVWFWDHKEGRAPKNWCFWIVVLEKTFENALDSTGINLNGNQSWILIGKTDAEAEAPILWPPEVKSLLIRKDPDAGKDWRQEEKRATEDEMVGWHHWFNGHEIRQTPGDGGGQGGLVCCNPEGSKELNTIWRLNSNNRNNHLIGWLRALSSILQSQSLR